MAEYGREQRNLLSRVIANSETESKQLKCFEDNRFQINNIYPFDNRPLINKNAVQLARNEALTLWNEKYKRGRNERRNINRTFVLDHYFYYDLVQAWNQNNEQNPILFEVDITEDMVWIHRTNSELRTAWNETVPEHKIEVNTDAEWRLFHSKEGTQESLLGEPDAFSPKEDQNAPKPSEQYIASFSNFPEISSDDAMIGQDKSNKHTLLDKMIAYKASHGGKLPYTLSGRLRALMQIWTPQGNKEFLDSLDGRKVIIATPFFLGYAYTLYDKSGQEKTQKKNSYEGDERRDFQKGLDNRKIYTFAEDTTTINDGTREEIAYLKYLGYQLDDDYLYLPPQENVEEDTSSDDSWGGYDYSKLCHK